MCVSLLCKGLHYSAFLLRGYSECSLIIGAGINESERSMLEGQTK
jgi:hypothetical protein